MAIAPSNPNTLYVGMAEQRVNYRAGLVGIWRTDNAWAATPTWTQLPNPPVYNDFSYSPRFWYHFYLLADPADANALYLTELDVWRYTGSWSSIAGITSYYNGLSYNLNLHPDNHVLAWVIGGANNKRLLLGNDGGVWLSDSPVPGTWHNLNNGLAITQIYRGAVDPRPDSPLALAGTQDNGTPVNNGSPGWPLFELGDGGDCAISVANPDTDWAVSYDVQYGSSDIFRTLSGGKPDQFVGGDLNFYLLPDYQQFYVHFEKSPRNDDLVIAGTARLWRCDNFFSGTTPSWSPNGPTMSDATGVSVPISAMGFAPTDTSGQIYAFGTEDGQMLITTNGGGSWNNLDPANAVPGRYISGLAFSPADPNVLYVTLSGFDEGTPGQPGHLFKTSNALALAPAWVNVSPPVDLPLNCLAIAPNDATNIFVGSDIGVWNTSNGGSSWIHYGPGSGMPNVAVYDLRMNSASQPTAFTHGRSAYAYEQVSIPILVLLGHFKCLACPPAPCFQCPPDSYWLNPGDLVSVEFPLQNISPVDAVNLSATMLATAQITPVTGKQSYGAIGANGGVVSRAFQFIANYGPAGGGPAGSPGPDGPIPGCGSTVPVTLQLQDGTNSLGTVTVSFKLGTLNRPLAESFDEMPGPVLPPGWQSVISGADQPWLMTTNPPPNAPGTEGEDAAPSVGPANVSVFTPDTVGIGQSSLLSPPFPVATAQAQLYFQQAFSVSNGYDGCILEIALGAQPFQEITQAGGSFARDGYNSRVNDFNPLGPRPAWSGDSGGWLPVYVNLPAAAAGQTVQLRWHFANSRGQTNGFWFVDAAQVTEPLCQPPVSNPVILKPAMEGDSFTFSINTVTSRTYVVEYKTNLTDNGWQFFQSFSGSGAAQTVAVPATSNRQAFYRFRVQ